MNKILKHLEKLTPTGWVGLAWLSSLPLSPRFPLAVQIAGFIAMLVVLWLSCLAWMRKSDE